MGSAIALREDFDSTDLRRFSRTTKDAGQSRRLLALAEIYDGGRRTDAARIGGVGLQVIRDWVLRFNADGPESLIDGKAWGQPPKLNCDQRQALARLVEDGPIPAIHGVVRWRLRDLAQWIWEEFGISLDETTVGRELKALGFVKISVRPRHLGQNEFAIEDFKKTFPPNWQKSGPHSRSTPRLNFGGRTRRGLARKPNSRGDGPSGEPGPEPPRINAQSRPGSSGPSVPHGVSVRPSSCHAATPRPCNGISMKSRLR